MFSPYLRSQPDPDLEGSHLLSPLQVLHLKVHSIPSKESLPPPEVQRIYRIIPEQYDKSVHIPSPVPVLHLPGISAPILQAAPGSSPEPDIHKLQV